MNFNTDKEEREQVANKILVAKSMTKPGALHGWASRGGNMNLKEGSSYRYQVVFEKKGEWMELCLYQYGLGSVPEKMKFNDKSVDVKYHNKLKEENKALKDLIKKQGTEIKKLNKYKQAKVDREQSKLCVDDGVDEI